MIHCAMALPVDGWVSQPSGMATLTRKRELVAVAIVRKKKRKLSNSDCALFCIQCVLARPQLSLSPLSARFPNWSVTL